MPTIQHFEIPADDVERAKRFYDSVFGWKMKRMNNPVHTDLDYWMFETQDTAGNPGLSGGMMKRQGTQHTITNYVTIPSIDEYVLKIEQAGGKVVIPKTPVPDMGFIVVFLDTENNMFGLFEMGIKD